MEVGEVAGPRSWGHSKNFEIYSRCGGKLPMDWELGSDK